MYIFHVFLENHIDPNLRKPIQKSYKCLATYFHFVFKKSTSERVVMNITIK